MSALEQELIEHIHNMNDEERKQVLEYIQKDIKPRQMTLGEWLKGAEALRAQLAIKYGPQHFPNAADVLEEIREERLNDIMGNL